MSFWLTWVICEEGASVEGLSPSVASGHVTRVFPWLMTDIGGPCPLCVVAPWAGGPGLCKKARWASPWEKAVSSSLLWLCVSACLLPPALTPYSDGLPWVLVMVFIIATANKVGQEGMLDKFGYFPLCLFFSLSNIYYVSDSCKKMVCHLLAVCSYCWDSLLMV